VPVPNCGFTPSGRIAAAGTSRPTAGQWQTNLPVVKRTSGSAHPPGLKMHEPRLIGSAVGEKMEPDHRCATAPPAPDRMPGITARIPRYAPTEPAGRDRRVRCPRGRSRSVLRRAPGAAPHGRPGFARHFGARPCVFRAKVGRFACRFGGSVLRTGVAVACDCHSPPVQEQPCPRRNPRRSSYGPSG
jgi:hypothetical protein